MGVNTVSSTRIGRIARATVRQRILHEGMSMSMASQGRMREARV